LVARVGLAEVELDALLAHLRQKRVVRKFGDDAEGRYELAHEVMVDKVWAWISDEELRVLDVRDMLRREMSNYEKFGQLLTRERLELVTSCCEELAPDARELELIFRSALAAGYEVGYWFGRAREGGVAVEGILRGSLGSEQPNTRADAAAILGDLGMTGAVTWLAGVLEDEYPHVRAKARAALQQIGTGQARQALRDHPPKDMIYVPAGEFVMGDEKPAHKVHLDAFYIGKYPVTNAEYARFVDCTGHYPPQHWPDGQTPAGKEDHPVVYVSWHDARAYARWAGMRLPTEAEWEKAASWDEARGEKRAYPWGDQFDETRCNVRESDIGDTTPVGRYSPASDSPYGCADMAGNVWEWTSSLYRDSPYQAGDGPVRGQAVGTRVLRGGSFNNNQNNARCVYRNNNHPDNRNDNNGFRVCVSHNFLNLAGNAARLRLGCRGRVL
jgi:formylglycine-generating enzyme required for sulfatase activity